MKIKRLLLLAIAANLLFVAGYLYLTPDPVAADAPQPAPPTATVNQPRDIQDQWAIIRQREEVLAGREAELKVLEGELDAKIKQLTELEVTISQEIAAYRQHKDARIDHLVKIYSSMKPKAAANLMNDLDESVAVEVCLNMKGEIAGSILSYMDTKKAALITQKLASYKKTQPTR